ncbi:MAG: hypothetical protein Q8J69_04140 [Sphingobacteriaceae bacterium]|nr:hypothetical protein [Sphingobacteriaceae bacterium]
MDPFSPFANSENLFKYLFLGGIFALLASIYLPIEKQNLLELHTIDLQKDTALLNVELKSIQFNLSVLELQKDSLSEEKFVERFEDIKKQKKLFDDTSIRIIFEAKKIETLDRQLSRIRCYALIGIILSFLMLIAGLIGWFVNFKPLNFKEQLKN